MRLVLIAEKIFVLLWTNFDCIIHIKVYGLIQHMPFVVMIVQEVVQTQCLYSAATIRTFALWVSFAFLVWLYIVQALWCVSILKITSGSTGVMQVGCKSQCTPDSKTSCCSSDLCNFPSKKSMKKVI